jgi:TonB-linked SusC/RagA family outer membrane protein
MYKSNYHTLSKRGYTTLLALLVSIITFAQNVTIKGVIFDETNLPLIGATVQVKGGQAGAATDLDGKYSIQAPKNGTLVISYIGYKTQEIKIQGKTSINVTLMPDNQTLDEVVVVGYGTMKKSDLTGSVASVSQKNVEGFKTSSVMEALGGQIAGVQITQNPGSGFNVNIRGVGTLTGDASPLYIVDGFEVSGIDHLANSDIESIEILKDASASAIYGARAANGVVLVTTRSGKTGKPVIVYNGSASYRNISKKLDMLSPYEFVKLQVELNKKYTDGYYREGVDKDGNPYPYQTLDDYLTEGGVRWQDETFNPTWSQDHNVTITGGTNDTKYSASFSHYDENGIFTNSGFQKTTGKFRVNQKLTKSLTLDATFNYSNIIREGVGTTADSGRFNMLAMILRARPTGGNSMTNEELLNSAIDVIELTEGDGSLAQVNPIKQAESVNNKRNAEMWGTNMSLTYKITKDLTFKTAATYNTTNTRADIFYTQESREAYRSGGNPYGQTQMTKDVRFVNYNNLTYRKKFNKKNTLDVMLGHEYSYRGSEYLLGQAKDFPFDNLGNDNLGLGATPSQVRTYKSEKRSLSFFARGTYNYDNRYLLTATVRADGSTVFSKKNKWGYFPSFSAAWRVSEEAFLKNIEWISNMKVRLGWGIVGNDRIANNLSQDLYTTSKYGIGSSLVTVLNSKHLPNKDLKWEGSSTTNLGFDLGFLANRLNVTADFFISPERPRSRLRSAAALPGSPVHPDRSR